MSDHLKDIPDASLKGGSKKSPKKDPSRKLIAREAGPESGEPALPRTRESGVVADTGTRWDTELENWRLLKPALLILCAVGAGVAVAPSWGSGILPSEAELEGTPATENIKAARDLVLEDTVTTARLRDEASAKIQRVYDFDALAADKIGDLTESALRIGASSIRAFMEQYPSARSPGKLSRTERERLEIELGEVLRAVRPQITEAWGTSLPPGAFDALERLRYDRDLILAVGALLRELLFQPVVDDTRELARERQGITIQRVPDDGNPMHREDPLDGIVDLEMLRDQIPSKLASMDLDPERQQLVGTLVASALRPTLTLNRAATELARAEAELGVRPAKIVVKKGEMVIRDGDRYTARHLLILGELSKAGRGTSTIIMGLGAGLLILILSLVALGFVQRRRKRRIYVSARDALFLTGIFLGTAMAGRLWLMAALPLAQTYEAIPFIAYFLAMPIAAGAMIVKLVLRFEVALSFLVVVSVFFGLLVESEPLLAVFALVGSVIGVTRLGTINARGDLLKAGALLGAGQAATAIALLMYGAQTDLLSYVLTVGMAFFGGILAGFVALAMTPVVEAVFGYTTDLKLLELANLNHPALKELIVQAPGSYHHSIIVGSLVEAAAEAIGANPLLAKVMAYYHDLGKGCNASYFIENQRGGHNPHDKLKPSMSAMVIRRHVTDGLEIAKRHGLGEAILAGIREHHGTTLIQFFYAKAKEQEEELDDAVSESEFRYPGRKPQTRESALVMLGDSVEAASRSLADPTPARLKGLTNKIINMKFTDGQLEECDLTLRDLHVIARRFIEVLTSIYHQRVAYPELGGKRDADPDSKSSQSTEGADGVGSQDRRDHLRRLGL